MLSTTVSTTAIFGAVFLGFLLTKTDFSRAVTTGIFLSALVLIPAPYFVGTAARRQALALGGLIAAAVTGAAVLHFAPEVSTHRSSLIKSQFYNLDVHIYARTFTKSAVRGGALARIGDRYLLLSGDGHLHVFYWEAVDRLSIETLPYQVPINGDAFSAAAGRPWADRVEGNVLQDAERREAGREILNTEWFRAYGLLVHLRTPSTFCPGTIMDFAGAASATERQAIISYLRTL